jgi:hypothetical protein
MFRLKKTLALSCLVTLAGTAFAPDAFAWRASVGAVSGQKKLMDGMGNGESDLSFSPILLEMAKLIGRTGLPPGFFLQHDGPLPEEPGVDLRTLLLYQAGLIKMPIRLITGKQPAVGNTPQEQPPMLVLEKLTSTEPAAGTSSMSSGTEGSLILQSQPLPRAPESVKVLTGQPSVGEPGKVQIAPTANNSGSAQPADAPLVSLDMSKLQADLKVYGDEQPAPEVKAEMPQLAMAMPRTNVMPFITKNAFRLWTFRSEGKPYAAQAAETATAEFNGTFVVSTTGAIKSITGRHFVLAPGKLLACNQGGELLFQTGLAEVSVDPNATAVMEVTHTDGGRVVKVYAIESLEGAGIEVKLLGGKADPVRLMAGEELVIADRALAATDMQGVLSAKKLNANTARGSFSVKDYVERDLMVTPQATADPEQVGTLSALKKRVTESR